MAIPNNITQAINSLFNTLSLISNFTSISSDGNKYELYVYAEVYAALSVHHILTPRGITPGGNFIFKCGPGPINNNYSYFEFSAGNGTIYQLRNGIEIQGCTLEHEVDVVVLRDDNTLTTGVRPDRHLLRIGLECKYYSSSSQLKGQVRKYLGVVIDICDRCTLVHPQHPQPIVHHFIPDPLLGFVTNISSAERQDLQDYLSAYSIKPHFGVLPSMPEEVAMEREITNYSNRL